MRPAIIVFAKAPVPGRVKTRLAERIGADAAAALHQAFVLDTLDRLSRLAGVADLELHTDVPMDAWGRPEVAQRLQTSGDLGIRMYRALATALSEGRPRVCIVGSDAPALPYGHIEELLGMDADVALGPCEDGGYYAIACRRVDERMFEGVEWSTERALAGTEAAARRCGLSVARGRPWYDVDDWAGFERLLRSGLPPHTEAWWRTYRRLVE